MRKLRDRIGKLTLKVRMISLLILCWLVPVIVISLILSITVSGQINRQLKENLTTSTVKVVGQIDIGLEDIKRASRNATYFEVISDAYTEYVKKKDTQKLYDRMTLYLAQQYRYDAALNSAILAFRTNPELFYSTYSAQTTYNKISVFESEYLADVMDISKDLDTRVCLYCANDSLYLMRNLVNNSYIPYAVLLLEIDKENLFDSLYSIWGCKDFGVFLNGNLIYGNDVYPEADIDFFSASDNAGFIKDKGNYYVTLTDKCENDYLTYIVCIDGGILKSGNTVSNIILLLVLLSIVPLGFAVFRFFDTKVSKPIEGLVKASEEIAAENYGYELVSDVGSAELDYVYTAFNEMSAKLKRQFEQIYLEEVAVRDANIKALQSQINPHFINNTLEIINWEARLNGVYKVSAMIEALSTMLNATLNRRNVIDITLREELEYVDAYLYIISERMGSRLTIKKEIDELLLNDMVPRLIAQPIIENAVEHGVMTTKEGYINIHVYARDEYMFIEIRNSGRMNKEDEDRINAILSGNLINDHHATSIGINNVNRRLKLMYGETCGLTIFNEGEETVNLLTFMRKGIDEKDTDSNNNSDVFDISRLRN